jgi:hypothetical protein
MKTLQILILFLVSQHLFADSPLTSTPFYKAYLDVEIIEKASKEHILNVDEIMYLLDSANSLDKRLALVNAKSFKLDSEPMNSEMFADSLKSLFITDSTNYLSIPSELKLLLAYIIAMEDYMYPNKAFSVITAVAEDKTIMKSSEYQLVVGLVLGNMIMETGFCDVWKNIEPFFNNAETPNSFRKEAIKIIQDYMIGYKKYCE